MKEMVVVLKCDEDTTHLADRTIAYMWDGIAYETDLCDKAAALFEEQMQHYVQSSRKAKRSKKKPATPKAVPAPIPAGDAGKAQRDEIRRWAKDNGYEQAGSGYIKRDVMDAYFAAHPQEVRS